MPPKPAPAPVSPSKRTHAVWWHDLGKWLDGLGVGQYGDTFRKNEIGPNEIPFLKEQHLVEMGISSVGDRLRIIDSIEAFLRAQRNRERRIVIMSFQDWHVLPCWEVCIPTYEICEGAIMVRRPSPFTCCLFVDNVDMSTVRDIKLYVGCFFGMVTVWTIDPSVPNGKFTMTLSIPNARKVYATIHSLWEEDQLLMSKRAERD